MGRNGPAQLVSAADPQLRKIMESYKGEARELISILQDIQQEYRYLSPSALRCVAEVLGISLMDVYGVATFFKSFRLQPPGRHTLTVCVGTACHVRGGPRIVDEIRRLLNIEPGETTKDGEYSLETVNCLGCCAIGPVLVMDDKYYGQVTPESVRKLLKQSKKSSN